VGILFALTIPGVVCLLVALVALERFGLWARRSSLLPWRRDAGPAPTQSLPLSGTGFQEIDAFFTGAKRAELDEKHSRTMMRDDSSDGTPPGAHVDLDAGVVTVHR